jgi:ATP-dependent DNA helicase RecG
LFADRLEIQSPGGLYGGVTEDNLEEEQSTRNRLLVRLMEDLHFVENRGSGIPVMLEAMRAANLEPPRFQDRRTSFWVIFRNHSLMNPEAIAWLNPFAARPLNDRQRLALVYLRFNPQMANRDYQRLNRVDSVTANRELRRLVELNLIEQHSTRRWAYYTLNLPPDTVERKPEVEASPEEKVLAWVRKHGFIKRSNCEQLLGVTPIQARYLLRKMRDAGLLRMEGRHKGTRYYPGPAAK